MTAAEQARAEVEALLPCDCKEADGRHFVGCPALKWEAAIVRLMPYFARAQREEKIDALWASDIRERNKLRERAERAENLLAAETARHRVALEACQAAVEAWLAGYVHDWSREWRYQVRANAARLTPVFERAQAPRWFNPVKAEWAALRERAERAEHLANTAAADCRDEMERAERAEAKADYLDESRGRMAVDLKAAEADVARLRRIVQEQGIDPNMPIPPYPLLQEQRNVARLREALLTITDYAEHGTWMDKRDPVSAARVALAATEPKPR